jgi:hypothetical protein
MSDSVNVHVRVWRRSHGIGPADSRDLAGGEALPRKQLNRGLRWWTIAPNTATVLTAEATGAGLNYQWFRGTTGQTFAPQAFGSKPRFVTPALSSVTEFWVRATDFLGQSADSDSATVTPNGAPEQGTVVGRATHRMGSLRPISQVQHSTPTIRTATGLATWSSMPSARIRIRLTAPACRWANIKVTTWSFRSRVSGRM